MKVISVYMKPLHLKTPFLESLELGEIAKSRIFLKMEAMQPSGSFKNRGIGHLCHHFASVEKAKSFVSSSGGNAGLAVAYSGRCLNVPVTVVIPKSSPHFMVERIEREGAKVIVEGENFNAADDLARKLAKQSGCFYISPFDHPLIWQGHASMIHEIKDSGLKPDAIMLSVGGGGLLCGVIQGLHEVGWSDVPVLTAETEGAASFAKSVQANKLITLDSIDTLAKSLGAKTVTKQALEWNKIHPIIPYIVSDKEAVQACLQFADHHRLLVEPACGAALSLVYGTYGAKIDTNKFRKIAVIICGGCAVTRELLQDWATQVSTRTSTSSGLVI